MTSFVLNKALHLNMRSVRWPPQSHQRHLSSNRSTPQASIAAPILIIGGGPTGLMFANLFQQHGTPFILLDAQTPERRFQHPQAHFLNTRTMEILKHALPAAYARIKEAIPPVHEWNSFNFGPSMQADTMARVQHPVDKPIFANQNANGKLVQQASKLPTDQTSPDMPSPTNLSDCSVGHLAQHTFCRILYEVAMDNHSNTTDAKTGTQRIEYGKHVSTIKKNHESDSPYSWDITTSCGQHIQCNALIASDGANSNMRSQLGISMQGTPDIQRLINVHFRIEDEATIPPAMLYTVFSPTVLAMVVRHGKGDYVMQIPYFHPYQTLEKDFTQEKVHEMVTAAVGDDKIPFQILSIRNWTMGSLVAERYFQQSIDQKNVAFLAGDAAHVFPPAGGFGMNTGLQDAFSLAWKLSLAHKQDPSFSNHSLSAIAESYQNERQPVARNNAALSVRNYQRVLGVTKSCYLDEKHPTLLLSALNGPMSFLPFEARRSSFLALLRTAMMPLGNLKNPSNPFTKHVTSNLQRLLNSGQGLPLLFPESEIGFSYNRNDRTDAQPHLPKSIQNWSNDPVAGQSRLKEGMVFPHLDACIENYSSINHSNACSLPDVNSKANPTISTRDLPAQISNEAAPVNFVIMAITEGGASSDSVSNVIDLARSLQKENSLPVIPVCLRIAASAHISSGASSDFKNENPDCLVLSIAKARWDEIEMPASVLETSRNDAVSLLVAIRPDGHAISIASNDSEGQQQLKDELLQLEYATVSNATC